MKFLKTTLFCFFLLPAVLLAQTNSFVPKSLVCNFWNNPYGVDVPNPDLGWTIQTAEGVRNMHQSAYQIFVASSPAILKKNEADVWNSGKIVSDKMLQIKYAGEELISSKQYWWKVRVWDEKGNASAWSQPSQWTMGLLEPSDWNAKWITADGAAKYAPVIEPIKTDFIVHRKQPMFWGKLPKPSDLNFSSMLLRTEFNAEPKLTRGVVHVCGLGNYELTINGKKVSNDLLAPGWSSYNKTVLYNTYDVTSFIKQGRNAIGLILSNGVYNILPDSVRYVKMLNTYAH